ncbi:leucine-rich repeat-containing protein 42-like [Gigantopelta aegis]|uniref:leucine-rich repeat-containing protein 42-like n=1 Tax=Gigantopelta aegis TaxID=1735272 RepID=UPI001B887FB6|nr:leucine-rich repeat-containing protein 42-like [Gigantopelta aegis]
MGLNALPPSSPTYLKACSVTRLVDLCITYVAKNLNYVESFVDFPDGIGEQIFAVAVSLGVFGERSRSEVTNMSLFSDAYGQQVLSHLNLSQNHLVANNYTDTICVFTGLTGLDLASCGLGDDHPLIAAVANIDSLLLLGLRNNALSDEGIRKMTSPIRMFKKGPLNLQKIDISDNTQITVKGVVYLRVFTQLQVIDLSGTSVKPLETAAFEEEMRLVQLTEKASDAPLFEVQTEGWAATVIEAWIQDCQRRQKLNTSKPKRLNFYSRTSRGINQDINSDRASFQTLAKTSVLVLTKQSTAGCHQQKTDVSVLSSQNCVNLEMKEMDCLFKTTNRTGSVDFEQVKPKVFLSKHPCKKRKQIELKDTGDCDDEDILLIAMYSGSENRKQSRFADLF